MDDKIPDDVGKRLGDLSDLPEALRKQIVKLDDLEEKIIQTMNHRFGGVATIDEVMVGLYRDFAYITEERRGLANKIYRMARANLLEAVESKKGVYRVK